MNIITYLKNIFKPIPSIQQLKMLPSLYPDEVRAIFTPPQSNWMIEIKHTQINENDIFIFYDINIEQIYLVWHCIDNPGHWRVVSNKGINTTIPDHWEQIF